MKLRGETLGAVVVVLSIMFLSVLVLWGWFDDPLPGLFIGLLLSSFYLARLHGERLTRQRMADQTAVMQRADAARTAQERQERDRAAAEREAQIDEIRARATAAAHRMSLEELRQAHTRLSDELNGARALEKTEEASRWEQHQRQCDQWREIEAHWLSSGQYNQAETIADHEAGPLGFVLKPDSMWSSRVDAARRAREHLEAELLVVEQVMVRRGAGVCVVELGEVRSFHRALDAEARAECNLESARLAVSLRFGGSEPQEVEANWSDDRLIVSAGSVEEALRRSGRRGERAFGDDDDWPGEMRLSWLAEGAELASTEYVPFVARVIAG